MLYVNILKHDLPQNGRSPVQAPFEEQVIDSDLWDDRQLKLRNQILRLFMVSYNLFLGFLSYAYLILFNKA